MDMGVFSDAVHTNTDSNLKTRTGFRKRAPSCKAQMYTSPSPERQNGGPTSRTQLTP